MASNSDGFGDDQGTRVGAPDQEKTSAPSQHSDTPPARREQSTGGGSEARVHDKDDVSEHDREHRSGYGGKGGAPDTSSDNRE